MSSRRRGLASEIQRHRLARLLIDQIVQLLKNQSYQRDC